MRFFNPQKKSIFIYLTIIFVISIILIPVISEAEDSPSNEMFEKNFFADIATETNDGVVKINTEMEVEQESDHPFLNDPYFRYFFGDQFPENDEPRREQGFGSGFIVSEEGYIVTNQHVVNKASEIEVTINGLEDPVPAELVWSDSSLDLAVLKVDVDEDLTVIDLGDSDDINPGDWAIAIGNPFGFEHTVTVGVISALGRPIQVPTQQGQVRSYSNLIQLDAAINPGNSGGPLLNIDGEAIGINTAVSQQGQGIGFAIPINEIKGIINELRETGDVIRPWLGISFRDINKDIQDYFELDNRDGVLVMNVMEDSPAAETGIQSYDIIKEINREKIENSEDVKDIINDTEVGQKVMVKIIRDGQSEVIFVEIGERPDNM